MSHFNIWEGVYTTFGDVPTVGDGFNSERYTHHSKKKIQKLLETWKERGPSPEAATYKDNILPILAALVQSISRGVRILDFGGGLGAAYIQVAHGLIYTNDLEFHIIEQKKVCDAGNEIFSDDKRIHFHSKLPKQIESVDIVHICSALQYIEEYEPLIKNLDQYHPKFFLFVDLPAGDIPTFVTAQNYFNSKIPYNFFNLDEILEIMTSLDYSLLMKSLFIGEILGKQKPLPLDNFPEKYRLRYSCNLLFKKEA